MTKVLIATEKPFAKVASDQIRTIFEEAGYEYNFLEKYTDKSELLNAVQDAEAIIIRSDKITSEVIEAAPKLKIVVRAGAGYDNVDLTAATEKDVVVMNTPGQNANAVAELVFGMMVYQARNHFNGSSGIELKGKKIGIHAYGNVGKNVARVAKGFGMDVFAFDPFVPAEAIKADGVTVLNDRDELYSTCDYISLHIPATKETIQSINYELLSKMKNEATLINTARKEVIHEEELLRFFRDNDNFKYISDIAPDNKVQLEAEFADRCFFTPKKMGAQTSEANINAGIAAAHQIIAFLEKGITQFKVN
ncbi:MAG: 3-phosphoglycerate dehydrogenase [Bacteroidales bacterium]|nr:3-phosphoglycerate dehydrogenase [Bacteroidales bacterium]